MDQSVVADTKVGSWNLSHLAASDYSHWDFAIRVAVDSEKPFAWIARWIISTHEDLNSMREDLTF